MDRGQGTRKKHVDGNVDIDYDPDEKQNRKKKGYEGGEYVDYEEIE